MYTNNNTISFTNTLLHEVIFTRILFYVISKIYDVHHNDID